MLYVLGVARSDVGLVAEEDARSMRELVGVKL